MSVCIKNSRLLYCLICGLGLVLFSAQGSHADSSPSTTEELCNEPGRPTLQKQFELAGQPLRHIPGLCRWLLQSPIVYRQSLKSGNSDSSSKEPSENEDEEFPQPDPKPGLEEFEEENVHLPSIDKEEKKESVVQQDASEPVVEQRPIEPEIQPVEPLEIKSTSKQFEQKAVESATQQKTTKKTPEKSILEQKAETGW